MTKTISFRRIVPKDGPSIARLAKLSPESGEYDGEYNYLIDAYEAYSYLYYPETIDGFVAEYYGEVVGLFVSVFGRRQYEGRLCQSVYNCMIHTLPDYRGRDIAYEIMRLHLDLIEKKLGSEAMHFGYIESDNKVSYNFTKKLPSYEFIEDRFVWAHCECGNRSPEPKDDIVIEHADPEEFGYIAEQLNAFYENHNLFAPETEESLKRWLHSTPFDSPIHHYIVAKDNNGDLLAGLGITEDYRLRILKESDVVIKESSVEKVWFAPGQLEAARDLFDTVRWEWCDKGDVIGVGFDPESPLASVYSKYHLHEFRYTLFIAGAMPVDEDKPFYVDF